MRLAKMFEKLIDESDDFEKLAPVPLSTICFRAKFNDCSDEKSNELNKTLMDNINRTGKVFISHTMLKNKFTIRYVVSGIRTEEKDVAAFWKVLIEEYKEIKRGG